MSIRAVVVEDHPVTRLGLVTVLNAQTDIEVVAECGSADEGLCHTLGFSPDLVIIPLRLDGHLAGVQLCREIKEQSNAHVLVYTSFYDSAETNAAYLSGADSLVNKSLETTTLLDAARSTAAGHRIWALSDTVDRRQEEMRALMAQTHLTQREQEILGFMLQRFSNNEIARQLHIEVSTVKTHVKHILQKLGVESRSVLLNRESGQ